MDTIKRPYDISKPSDEVARQILLDWLRDHPSANQITYDGRQYAQYVEFVGCADFDELASQVAAAFWALLIEGIVVPGKGAQPSELNLPWFRVTLHGKKVLASGAGHPHDPAGYLAQIRRRVPSPDGTIMAYLAESLETFKRGSDVASMVMLGIAAERVFLLLCESVKTALVSSTEIGDFTKILGRHPMKPKLDWVHAKLKDVQEKRSSGLPDNALLMTTTIYDILRNQRNDLGHPRELPPAVDHEEAFAVLQVFPRFYETAETVRAWLAANKI